MADATSHPNTDAPRVAETPPRSEAHYHAIFEALPEGVIVQDADGVLTSANAAAVGILGLSADEMAGRVSADPRWGAVRDDGTAFSPEEHPPMVALRTGQTQRDVVMGLRRTDGSLIWVSVNSQPMFDPETGGVWGVVSSFFDFTAERQARQAAQARAEREALLVRIGEALRSSPDPEAVQGAALALLGAALGADRCYFARYDLGGGVVAIGRDWYREGLPSIRGEYLFPNTAEMFQELYHGSRVSVVEDMTTVPVSAQTRTNAARLGLRSRLSVALAGDGEAVATLTLAMADGPRTWTADEVALVEAVATPLGEAVARAGAVQREHRIAEQLQAALQPAVPATVPGMEVAAYYRPAWEDQGVGGDFSDVFAADKGVTFLVVSDLAGKGLAAASQVAAVRHMLRFALLNGRSVAGPVSALNDTLADHDLLTGFATLFVGRYEAQTRRLSYVNCGQDAGLILRAATGRVEALPPTGPVLGALVGAEFTETELTLAAGDVLALYTDGLTEAGPTRTALLTGDGVADLLSGIAGTRDPKEIVQRLMAGVDAYAGAGVRDDQCLLVGVVSQAEASSEPEPVRNPR